MNTLAIILLEVQMRALILTLFGALFSVIILNTECIDNFFKNLGRNIQRKLRHKNQKNKTSIEVHNDVKENIQHSDNVIKVNSDSKDNMQFS